MDDVDGTPITANEYAVPPDISDAPTFSVIRNTVVGAAGAVKKKLKVAPPFVDVNAGVPVPGVPVVSYVGTVKSDEIPTEPPVASKTVIVQEISSLTRTYVVNPPVCPMQDKTEETVGEDILNANELPTRADDGETSFSVM